MANKSTITYNGKTLFETEESGNVAITYNGKTLATLGGGSSKTLNCANKYMLTNLVIGSKTLKCANKLMASNVGISVVSLTNKMYITFAGNLYEYEFANGMTWSNFVSSGYNDGKFSFGNAKIKFNVGDAEVQNVLLFNGAPVLTAELDRANINPNIFILGDGSINPNMVNGKTYIAQIEALENIPWITVSAISRAGKAQNYWKIGDTKPFVCNGTTYTAQIVAFDQYDVTDSASYGRTKVGIVFQFKELYGTKYSYHNTKSAPNFASTQLYTTHLPEVQSKLESSLSSVLVGVNMKSKNASNQIYDITNQKFTLPALVEIFGDASGVRTEEKLEGSQYAFYVAGNSPKKQTAESNGNWWTRTIYNSSNMRCVSATGSIGTLYYTNAFYIAPVFFV